MADRDELLIHFIQVTACDPVRARTLLTAKYVYQVSMWLQQNVFKYQVVIFSCLIDHSLYDTQNAICSTF